MEWLKRLREAGVIGEDDFHREYGKQSGYPKCCIEFFIDLEKYTDSQALVADLIYGPDSLDVYYVRCTACRD